MLNVRQLQVLRMVMQTGSVSSAARLLHISQPAVTKSIHLVEETVGMTLFLRIKGRLVQTPEARELMPEIERLFSTLQSVEEIAERVRDGFAGHIRVATGAALSASIVAKAMAEFQRERDGVRFDVRAFATRHVIDYINHAQVEIGVIDVPFSDPEIDMQELCRAEIGCVIPSKHRLAGAKAIGPRDLVSENIITFAEDTLTGQRIRESFRSAHAACKIVYTTNQTFSAYALVNAGAGVALVDPFPALSGAFADLVVVPFRPRIEMRPQILVSRQRPISQLGLAFIEKLLATARGYAQTSGKLLTASEK
jgi:DNA-binding transcriptional LysR family regulator